MRIQLDQQTEEWLNFRRNKITATDACAIMGVSPWKTSYETWLDKMGLLKPQEKSQWMQRGIELEKEARENFEKLVGVSVSAQIVVSDELPWQMASLDGLSDDDQVLVEIKCPGVDDHHLAKVGGIPPKYMPQLQHQMSVCNLDEMFYYSYDGRNGCLVKVKRDNKYLEYLLKKEMEFWNCVQTFTPPALSYRDYVTVENNEWLQTTTQLKHVQNQIKQLEEMESNLKEKLISSCNGTNSQGNGIRVMRTIRKGNIDYSKIEELENVDLEQYRKPNIQYWKISKVSDV